MNIRRIIGATLATLLLTALLALPASAKVVSPGKEFYYLDQADVLSEATEGEIFFSNQLLEDACGAQIVVVAVNTTGSESIDDYAYDLFNDWGIGDAKKKNGFLLLLAIKDDDYYALCGTELESRLTSGVLNQYFDDYLETDFAAKRYDAGVRKFFEAVFARVADIYSAKVTTEQGIAAYEAWDAEGRTTDMVAASRGAMAPAEKDEGISMGMIIFVVVLIIVLAALTGGRRRRRRGMFVAPPPPPPPPGPGMVGRGGYRGTNWRARGVGAGLFRSFMGSGSARPSGGSRPSGSSWSSGSSRSSGSSFGSSHSSGGSRSFGSARGGGGSTRGGGAGRGRH